MSELQNLLALVVLVYVLCVIVQAIQEVLKSVLNIKAKTMAEIIKKFMGDRLTLSQVCDALQARGLSITALEHFNKQDFRSLLDGIQFTAQQVQQIPKIVASQAATVEELKNQAAAAYDGARAEFQQLYAANNKRWVIAISFAVVLSLNASLINIYEILTVNQNLSQAIAGTASTVASLNQSAHASGTAPSLDPTVVYSENRQAIKEDLQNYPILLRTKKYRDDFRASPIDEIAGLLIMGLLVSLGAPFWNDVLKGVTGVNNALNSNGPKGS
jgi:hypothetical protein